MIHEPRVQEPPRTETMRPVVSEYAAPIDRTVLPSHVGWGALIAGVVTAMALQVLLTVLGIAVGMSIPGTTGTAEGMTMGAGIWWAVAGIISLFAGGWVAARLALARLGRSHVTTREHEMHGTMYGFLTWGTLTALTVVLAASFGTTLAGGAMGGVLQQDQPAAQFTPDRTQPQIASGTAGAPVGDIRPANEETRRDLAVASWGMFIALLLGAGAAALGGYTAASAGRYTIDKNRSDSDRDRSDRSGVTRNT